MLRRNFLGTAAAVASLLVDRASSAVGVDCVSLAAQENGLLTQVWTDGDSQLVVDFVRAYMDALHPSWRQDRIAKFCLDRHTEFMLREGYTFANCAYEQSQSSLDKAICSSIIPVVRKSADEFCSKKLKVFTLHFVITLQECNDMLSSSGSKRSVHVDRNLLHSNGGD